MKQLNLPPYDFRFRETEGSLQIFDPLRKKFIVLTPEEWVRQNFIQYLVREKKYPSSLMAVESGVTYNRLRKRTDIQVYDRKGGLWMIVECKKPEIAVSQEVFDQAALYNMAHKTKTRFLAVTNGMKHYCCSMDYRQNSYQFLKSIPEFE